MTATVMSVLTLKKNKYKLQTGSSQMHETLHASDAPGAAFLLFSMDPSCLFLLYEGVFKSKKEKKKTCCLYKIIKKQTNRSNAK